MKWPAETFPLKDTSVTWVRISPQLLTRKQFTIILISSYHVTKGLVCSHNYSLVIPSQCAQCHRFWTFYSAKFVDKYSQLKPKHRTQKKAFLSITYRLRKSLNPVQKINPQEMNQILSIA
jgi:hypothetical protein